MNVLPPAFFYAIGVLLVVFGALRAYHLGWKRKAAVQAEAPEQAEGWSRTAGGGYKRHITFGVLWFGMGLFLIISTVLNTPR
jgi:hypothetical protein